MTPPRIRSTMVRVAVALCAVFALVALIHPPAMAYAADLLTHGHHLTSAGAHSVLSAGLIGPVVAYTPAQIDAFSKPGNAKMRAVRGVLYDSQQYVSGTTVQLKFFGAINADKSLSNVLGNGGVIPDGAAFIPRLLSVTVLNDASVGNGTVAGALSDIAKLTMIGRGYAVIQIGQFPIPEIPIRFLHGSGGPVGNVGTSLTAPANMQFGTNGVQDGGFDISGSFAVTPDLRLSVTLNWPAPVTLSGGNTYIAVEMVGDWQFAVGQ